jgi:uncharacterized protein YdaU (DUF1376 family)
MTEKKKGKQPYIPLYIGDWLQDTDCLSIEAEGAWLRVVFKCWKNKGIFTATEDVFARMCKVDVKKFASILLEWQQNDICNIKPEGEGRITITNRRIQREKAISDVRAEVGASGGKASRNTRTKKLYDSPGFLYLVKDEDKPGEFKVGISKDPDKRLSGIRRAYKREHVSIVFKWPVPDMGNYEDSILEYYKDVRDGEWIYMDITAEQIRSEISTLIQEQTNSKSKPKERQIPDNDNEYDNDIVIEYKEEKKEKTHTITVVDDSRETDESLCDVEQWTQDVIEGNDEHFNLMISKRKVPVNGQLEPLARSHLGLCSRYAWHKKMETQQAFRNSLIDHITKEIANASTKRSPRETGPEPGKDYTERF